jgi:hypothetical protein
MTFHDRFKPQADSDSLSITAVCGLTDSDMSMPVHVLSGSDKDLHS